MSYEIVSQNINGDYGTVSVAFTIEMGYGERAGSHTYTENIPVYRYGGVWWIGEGHTEDIMELWSRIKNITEFYGSF
ncbi:MAG: hypothetical protein IJ190_11825 [Prevotella sp.]|nr:hypothetical protein [Prevotella sp.]